MLDASSFPLFVRTSIRWEPFHRVSLGLSSCLHSGLFIFFSMILQFISVVASMSGIRSQLSLLSWQTVKASLRGKGNFIWHEICWQSCHRRLLSLCITTSCFAFSVLLPSPRSRFWAPFSSGQKQKKRPKNRGHVECLRHFRGRLDPPGFGKLTVKNPSELSETLDNLEFEKIFSAVTCGKKKL